MNVLIIGGGGREHAIAWKVAASNRVEHVYVAPGNAGTATEPKVSNLDIAVDQTDVLIEFAQRNNIEVTIVGPEVPLVDGVVDAFEAQGLKIFGPNAAAAQLEGSKSFSKDFLKKHNIPTAAFEVFTDTDAALAYLQNAQLPIVVKADGLAAGKGVIVAQTREDANTAVKDMLSGNAFGTAGHRVVIEDFLQGEEASFICLVDGKTVLPLASSQDHKARDNGDLGPNTGGMGAYSPAPVVDDSMHQHIMRDIIQPTVVGMVEDGTPFRGFLYAGLMIENGQARVIEFNVRLGDPETQPILMRMDSDIVELILSALNGTLDTCNIKWKPQTAVGVVMAAGGYPASYEKNQLISGLDQADNDFCKVFHAGTKTSGDDVETNGGRVLCVVGLGSDAEDAQTAAYESVGKITWKDAYYRTDIAYRAVRRT